MHIALLKMKQIPISRVKWRISVIKPVITDSGPSWSAISKKNLGHCLGTVPPKCPTKRHAAAAWEVRFYRTPHGRACTRHLKISYSSRAPVKKLFVGVFTDFLTNPKIAFIFNFCFWIF
jgi:hypothetical protein